jgi:hypothetical protein
MLSKLSSVIFFVLLSLKLFAQDNIVLRNGDVLRGKVVEVGTREIKYTTNAEPGSAVFLIAKKKTKKISFGSGEEVVTGADNEYRTSADLQRNIITVSPFKVMDLGMGYGVSYERQLGDKKLVALILPFTMIFPRRDDYYESDNADLNKNFGYYLNPGIKIYPFGQKKVSYAMGANLLFGRTYIWEYQRNFDSYTKEYYYDNFKKAKTRMALMVNNYLNLQVTKHLQIGINAGIGPVLMRKVKYFSDRDYYDNYDYDDNVVGEVAFNFAYRF